MSTNRRIVFVQYSNPAAYPPVEHAAHILADAGWEIVLHGTGAQGEADTFEFPPHPRIRVELMPFAPAGPSQKLHYLRFAARALLELRRARVCYASDPWSAPVALAASRMRVPVIYHEHDTPEPGGGRIRRTLMRARASLARNARLCVLPAETRRAAFAAAHPEAKTLTVMNCPALAHVRGPAPADDGDFVLYYHGSIVPERVPIALVDALPLLPAGVSLELVGYETIGSTGWVDTLLRRATALGVRDRIRWSGSVPLHVTLFERAARAALGLALVPRETGSFDLRSMAGASNKPFEYLAVGLPLLVSDLPDWRAMFVELGYGAACDPASARSIAGVIGRLHADRRALRAMGEQGRQRVLHEWNYQHQFAPVMRIIEELAP